MESRVEIRRKWKKRTLGQTLVILALSFAASSAFPPTPSHGDDIPKAPARLPKGLVELVPDYPESTKTFLRALKQGITEFRNARYPAALTSLPDPAAAYTSLIGDYVLLYRARAHLMLDRNAEALKLFRDLQSRFPHSPLIGDAVLQEAKALLALGNGRGALDLLQKKAPDAHSETLYLSAQALEMLGESADAQDIYLRLYTDFVNSESSSLARERLLKLAPASLTPRANYRALLQRAENLLLAGKSREARNQLLNLPAAEAPDAEAATMRHLLFGSAEFNIGRSLPAVDHLKKVPASAGPAHAEALYLLAASYRRLKDESSFLKTRDLALKQHPKSPFTEKLLYSVATYFDLKKDPEAADEAYRAIATRFPQGEHAPRARWKVALHQYLREDYAAALRKFWEHLLADPNPGSASEPLYWMGRCFEKLGDRAYAEELYAQANALANDSYYGQRAASALREEGRSSPKAGAAEILDRRQVSRLLDGLSLKHPADLRLGPNVSRVIERAGLLLAADLTQSALREVSKALEQYPHEKTLSYVLSKIHERDENYFGVIVSLRRAFPDYAEYPDTNLPPELWQLLFPVRHDEIVSRQSEKHGVERSLILAIIRQESAFNVRARSTANARGLMQILPSTGASIARRAGVSSFTTSKLYSPDVNIALGTYHLSTLLRRFDGRLELALAAYNAGVHRVDGWLGEFGRVDLDEFVERIPFAETRGYVKRVITNLAHYRRLSQDPSAERAP